MGNQPILAYGNCSCERSSSVFECTIENPPWGCTWAHLFSIQVSPFRYPSIKTLIKWRHLCTSTQFTTSTKNCTIIFSPFFILHICGC